MELDKRYKLEADLTKYVKKWLDLQSDVCYRKISDRFNKGISDILCCVNGIFVAVELKADDGKASPHQVFFIKDVLDHGGIGGVCYTLQDVVDLIEQARILRKDS